MKKVLVYFSFALLTISAFWDSSAQAQGQWMVRERFENFDPESGQGQVNMNHDTVPELDATYFFDRNFAAEFSLTAEDPNISNRNTGAGLGDVWIIPFDAILQYHFTTGSAFQPYAGVGVNVSLFYPSSSSVSFNNSVDPVLQVGSDFQLNRNWFLNLDIKKEFMRPDVGINGSSLTTDKFDPWVFGLGVGYKF